MSTALVGLTWVDTLILVIYLLTILLAGLWFSRNEMHGRKFFKGDGTIPWWVTGTSIYATLLSPISFMSIPGNSYSGTWASWFAQLGLFIAIPLAIRFFLPLYSHLEIDTAYHYLEKRFECKKLRALGAVMFIIYQLGRMSIIMYLPCIVLEKLTGIDVNILIIAMGSVVLIYTYVGGLKTVIWTDFLQGIVLLGSVIVAFFILLSQLQGGMGTVLDSLTTGNKFLGEKDIFFSTDILSSSLFIIFLGGGFSTFASFISSQDIVQRFTTTTDMKQLSKMLIGNGVLSLFSATIFYLAGTALYSFYVQNPGLITTTRPDQIFISYITYELPVGVSGLLIAGVYAAAQSTISSGINAIAASWVRGAAAGFIVSAGMIIFLKYFVPSVSFWWYTILTILVSLLVGWVASRIEAQSTGTAYRARPGTTIYSLSPDE